jgi:hypothetical protein
LAQWVKPAANAEKLLSMMGGSKIDISVLALI